MILTADLHLTDKTEDEYRWKVFDHLYEHSDGEIFILGDLADRADRHSSILVNRLIGALTELTRGGSRVTILLGNHDMPLKGEPYWSFLNYIKDVSFITTPTADADLLLLPYSANPIEEWKGIPFHLYRAAFMHQTVDGVDVGRGRTLQNPNMIVFPPNITVYSGDIHIPQTLDNVTYVSAPHNVRFGDVHRCRLLVLDEDYKIKREVTLRRVQKRVIEISSIEQLKALRTAPGDQARIRFTLPASSMEQWPIEQQAISEWAQEQGVQLASVEAIIETSPDRDSKFSFDADPKQVLEGYCKVEGIGADLLDVGLEFLHNHK